MSFATFYQEKVWPTPGPKESPSWKMAKRYLDSTIFTLMDSRRQQKVSKVILQDLADIFQKESKTMFGGAFITVTIVRVSPDLSSARVFLSIMGEGKDEAMKLVEKQNKEIRKNLAARVRHQLRKVPELSFKIDDSLDYYEEINDLLK